MKLIRNAVGISTFMHILLLLVAAIVGAVLSYMWTMGYYVSLGVQLPEAPTVTITNVAFNPQDPTFFNLTLLNPTFSPFSVSVEQVMVSTEDGVLDDVAVIPTQPTLSIGESKILTCIWNWANHTDENLRIHIFVADGSGATFQAKTPLVEFAITGVFFNSTISLTHFNVTIQNSASSATYVNLTSITVSVNDETLPINETDPSLPYPLDPNSSCTFVCSWNWTNYKGMNVIVVVDTLQGFRVRSSPPILIPNSTQQQSFGMPLQATPSSFTRHTSNYAQFHIQVLVVKSKMTD